MNKNFPIYTVLCECHDCYKCVRRCPVKAIKVNNGSASVITQECVSCGECVMVCPSKAKRIRNDVKLVKSFLQSGAVVSLAPSWVSCYPKISFSTMRLALQTLGFTDVFETADGADRVSKETVEILKNSKGGIFISSACPSAVTFIRRHLPNYAKNIMQLPSPVLTQAASLKAQGFQKVVFIGPCAAKKSEADHSDVLDASLTFSELNNWFEQSKINLEELELENKQTSKSDLGMGIYYPVEGGMLKYIKQELPDVIGISVSGLNHIDEVLSGKIENEFEQTVFIEVLACSSGCINGPGWGGQRRGGNLSDILAIESRSHQIQSTASVTDKLPDLPAEIFNCQPCEGDNFLENELQCALKSIGKYSSEDELNCAGCGYQTCRNFAKALISGKAEIEMCVSYMRKLAQKKANALIKYIPAGVVVVGAAMKIIEANRRFAMIFGEESLLVFDELGGFDGAALNNIVPFSELFETALASGKDLVRNGYRYNDKLLDIKIFTIEPAVMVGAVIEDVTEIECSREKIAEKAREVIKKNVLTVQHIAKCLGEHMADTELLLRQVADGFDEEK